MVFGDTCTDRAAEIASFGKMRYLCRVKPSLSIASAARKGARLLALLVLLAVSACSYRPPTALMRPEPAQPDAVDEADADRPLVLAVPHQPMPPIPRPDQLRPLPPLEADDAPGDTAQPYRPPYTLGTNLVAVADTVLLACLPVRDCYQLLLRGERVVVAEWMAERQDTAATDVIWVKLAHSEAVQGWIREDDMRRQFVPTDPVSQFIHAFSQGHWPWFVAVCALTVVLWMARLLRRRRAFRQMVLADSRAMSTTLPLLLVLLMAVVATLYQSIQVFAPDLWERYYYAPSLSPLGQPAPLAALLAGVWLLLVVLIATVDELFRRLPASHALLLLPLLASACICCYSLFILTVPVFVGYLLLLALLAAFVRHLSLSLRTPQYRCGRCGHPLPAKGRCPHCGAENV